LNSELFNPGASAVFLADIAVVNKITPISFIYRKSAHEIVGYYNEELPVLGDWEFYLRFLCKFDIYKMNEALAFHHLRNKSTNQYGNTIIAGLDEHCRTDALIRNSLLRRDINSGRLGMGFIVNAAIMNSTHPIYNAVLPQQASSDKEKE
jgi:hypothetical protein